MTCDTGWQISYNRLDKSLPSVWLIGDSPEKWSFSFTHIATKFLERANLVSEFLFSCPPRARGERDPEKEARNVLEDN